SEQFDTLVQRLEEYARKRPAQYRVRVGLLAAMGYAYIVLVLALLFALLGALVVAGSHSEARYLVGKLGWIVLSLAVIVLRALWVRFPAPRGLELRRDQAPALFRMLDELWSSLRAPRFHHVQLIEEFNAAVVQVPRLGLLGWQRNYLLLGLPLMQALSPEQF